MVQRFEKDEDAKEKRMRRLHNSMHKMWTDFKQTRKERFDIMSHRKADEELARRERDNEMLAKLQRS